MLVNELAALKADIDAIWHPSCNSDIDAVSQTIQAAELKKLFAALGCPPGSPGFGAFNANTYIDPSGTVITTSGLPVKYATVTILHSYTKNGAYLPVNASSPGILPAVNPEITAGNGIFHWEVYAGWYKVRATAPGCVNPARRSAKVVTIGPYPVPSPQTGSISGSPTPQAPAQSSKPTGSATTKQQPPPSFPARGRRLRNSASGRCG